MLCHPWLVEFGHYISVLVLSRILGRASETPWKAAGMRLYHACQPPKIQGKPRSRNFREGVARKLNA